MQNQRMLKNGDQVCVQIAITSLYKFCPIISLSQYRISLQFKLQLVWNGRSGVAKFRCFKYVFTADNTSSVKLKTDSCLSGSWISCCAFALGH